MNLQRKAESSKYLIEIEVSPLPAVPGGTESKATSGFRVRT